MQLYYWPKSRAFRVLWALEEIGAPYELVRVDIRAGEQATPAFRALNPMTKVPVLRDGEAVVAESAAILLYLADRHPEAELAPAVDDPVRGRFLQWLFFTPSCLEPAMAEKYTGAASNPFSFGWGDFNRTLWALEEAIEVGPWLLGERFSMADILLASTLIVALQARLVEPTPRIQAYLDAIPGRPGFRLAAEIEAREAALL